MDYRKHYNLLIKRGKTRILEGYKESHHIVPRCLGGTDDPENLVDLTAEEHYVAHQLLVKMYPNEPKLVWAAQMMIPNRPSNKLYGWLKRKHSDVVSSKQTGKNNSQFGTIWITDGVDSKKIIRSDAVPDGWYAGRVCKIVKKRTFVKKEATPNLKKPLTECHECFTILRNLRGKERAVRLYKDFLKSGLTMRDYAINHTDIKHSAFSRLIARHLTKEDKDTIQGGLD